ncbi:MAG: YaiI/YqxD family protein [Deltaproteobacteria bacterium]|nr:YaiI/YqxD family protein [bacterium]MCB9477568.1 YaiI/YqxD family protein [Deltaproteobacteria bacterium]MCB9487672.1 YaiI/YqxD family protein [Deltaproteobacteria bacterium]
MTTIYIDADGCPVKDEIYKAAAKYQLPVRVVANQYMSVPMSPRIEMIVVDAGPDVADDWIAERAGESDIVVTADVPLASRCIERGARVLDVRGGEWTPDSIGSALASRELMDNLRMMGVVSGGPAPMGGKTRSQFTSKLHQTIQDILRPSG